MSHKRNKSLKVGDRVTLKDFVGEMFGIVEGFQIVRKTEIVWVRWNGACYQSGLKRKGLINLDRKI